MPSPQADLAYLQSLLHKFGPVGDAAWVAAQSLPTERDRYAYCKDQLIRLARAVKNAGVWKEGHPPVGFKEFVESPEYLNQPNILYPKVLKEGEELNSGKYVEAVLTGGIGVGKTTLAVFTTCYQLYVISRYKNPHAMWAISPADEIIFVIQSLNAGLAKDVDYKRMRNLIGASPYFQRHFSFDKDRLNQMEFDGNIIVKPVSGDSNAIIGQNVIGGIIDEVNFMAVIEKSKQVRDGGTYDQAVELYQAIHDRRNSRFMFQGKVPGMLCLVSSKQYPGEFTDVKIGEQQRELREHGKSRIYVYDKREWDVKPLSKFTGKWFVVFLGDDTRKPRIAGDHEDIPPEDVHLYMEVPLENKPSFESNILKAVRDICGHSTFAMHPFIIDPEPVKECFGKVLPILSTDICDFATMRPVAYPKRFKHLDCPRFVHLDLSLTGDSTGIACGYVPKFIPVQRTGMVEIMPQIVYDFVLEVRPPKGGEIEFAKIRELIYNLRQLGLPIKWVSMDSFQSTDTKQILGTQGFVTGIFSLDIDTKGYDVAKQAFQDRRIRAPVHERAMKEFIRLERDPVKQTIDHPPNYSKDCSDAMAGVAYGLTMRREIWAQHNIPLGQIPDHLQKKAA